MKKFFTYLILTLFLIFTIDQILDRYLSSLYENNFCDNAGGDLNHYLKHERKDVVIIGSSRVENMINPEIIAKSAINISKPAKHFYYNIAVADLLDQHKKMPGKVLIFNIEVEDIYKENEERLINDVFYLKYYYYSNEFIKSVINSKSRFEKCKYIFRSYRFNGDNFTIVTNPLQNICVSSKNGFYPLTKSKNDKNRLDQGVKEMKLLTYKNQNPEFFKKLKHLVELCKKNKVKLIVLYGPNFYLPDCFRQASLTLKKYCKKNKINYLDYSLSHFKDFANSDLWYDQFHLNNIGAEKYSRMLNKDIDILLKKSGN
jgi:hypothetical protein